MSAFYLLLPFLDVGELASATVSYATVTGLQSKVRVMMCSSDSSTGVNVSSTAPNLAPSSYALNKVIFRGYSIFRIDSPGEYE